MLYTTLSLMCYFSCSQWNYVNTIIPNFSTRLKEVIFMGKTTLAAHGHADIYNQFCSAPKILLKNKTNKQNKTETHAHA